MNEIRKQLLQALLASRGFVSGEELSQQLSVSRTAIWKHIEELRKEGYQIEAVRKQGYRLVAEPNTLSPSVIASHLRTKWLGHDLHYFDEVESTQTIAHRLAREGAPAGTVVLADHQQAGKGRLGRTWFSPKGTGLWMSLVVRPHIPLTSVPQLTLLTAVAVLRAVKQTTSIALSIKWPNDLLYGGQKVAGILTELNAEADRVNYVVIGVGLNVNQEAEDFPPELSSKAISLKLAAQKPISRKDLVVAILQEWENVYNLYQQHGFGPVKTLWEAHTCSLGQRIVARTPHGQVEGVARGITDEGALLLEDGQGHVHRIYSADIETL
ncbi:BirA family biotin operon repressor/biotin-[acetyl-CoA-carboxylase] ligase [Caldalkalibacillus uzonensis]|uniref:Bifunctional ligase/repressor BirA n=1 Tax=Caldalkalibacillus uzonensis TaxID=353224 RepID=A0ABU0CMI1_9BACI|nr:biotin--[acetyl-CoA-carboxylase] ligase [Caldalkalibacillus uzonensis]MDQ0337626.1 BirA family biotin operon repressor/biotin-[acetyl-CoA-carboxylase] ligase [Caldalkalibacillus uzonensis]